MKLHTDFKIKVTVNTESVPWAASPVKDVDRKCSSVMVLKLLVQPAWYVMRPIPDSQLISMI